MGLGAVGTRVLGLTLQLDTLTQHAKEAARTWRLNKVLIKKSALDI